jgi:hypothetical protein
MDHWGYLAGLALILVAFLIGRRGGGNRIQARDVPGIAIGGDASGTITQNVQSGPQTRDNKPDRVAWAIGIVAVLIAAAQLAHDIFWTK